MNYDFLTLNDKDFEVLVLTLLNRKYNLNLQSFKRGRDYGVDLRYSTSANNNEIVVQVKHFAGSKITHLRSALKKEVPKVYNLKPAQYILVTSLPLSAKDKDELRSIVSPFIKSSNDVIGKEDLNNFLEEFPDIQKNFFKLWFSIRAATNEEHLQPAFKERVAFEIKVNNHTASSILSTVSFQHCNIQRAKYRGAQGAIRTS